MSELRFFSLLTELANALKKSKAKDIVVQENFETLYSFLRYFFRSLVICSNSRSKLPSLNEQIVDRVYEIICSGLSNIAKSLADVLSREQVEEVTPEALLFHVFLSLIPLFFRQYNAYRNALKMYLFLVHWFVFTPKKAKAEMTDAPVTKTKVSLALDSSFLLLVLNFSCEHRVVLRVRKNLHPLCLAGNLSHRRRPCSLQ